MALINKKLPLNTALGDREIRRSPYTLAITELQELATRASRKIPISLTFSSGANTYEMEDVNVVIVKADVNGGIMIPPADTDIPWLKNIYVKVTHDSVGTVNLSSATGDIDGGAALLSPADSVELFTDGTNWHII